MFLLQGTVKSDLALEDGSNGESACQGEYSSSEGIQENSTERSFRFIRSSGDIREYY